MAGDDEQDRKRTPFSAKLPQVGVKLAVPIADALAALGAAATPHVIAQQMGTTYSSSGFKTKLAAAGYYGFVEADGPRRALTKRGIALTSGDKAKAREALREGVMSTNFGPVIHSLRGRVVSEATVALRLQNDLQVPDTSSKNIAKALMASARDAELLNEGSQLDAVAIENVADVIPKPGDIASNGDSPHPTATRPQPAEQRKPRSENEKHQEKPEDKKMPPFANNVQVVVNVDASELTPQQIAELVRELQRGSS